MSNPIVVDLSHWQPDPIDWKALKAGGTQGVILKATEGLTYVDPTFGARQKAARDAGLAVASYHFLQHGDIANQMHWYLQRVAPNDGDRLVIDFEKAGCTFQDLESSVQYLLDNTMCEVAVYGSSLLRETCANRKSDVLAGTSLWAARYSSNQPEVPTPWSQWDLWQYTDKASVTGISGTVDGNKWNSAAGDIHDWFYNADAAPDPGLPVVSVSITVDRPCTLIVNGTKIESSA